VCRCVEQKYLYIIYKKKSKTKNINVIRKTYVRKYKTCVRLYVSFRGPGPGPGPYGLITSYIALFFWPSQGRGHSAYHWRERPNRTVSKVPDAPRSRLLSGPAWRPHPPDRFVCWRATKRSTWSRVSVSAFPTASNNSRPPQKKIRLFFFFYLFYRESRI